MLLESAPAKVNLTLRVLGRRKDGYHELRSLAAFALDCADTLSLVPAEAFALSAVGPFASAVDGPNIVAQAAERFAAAALGQRTGNFTLVKRLPVAAGIGGGSADAAAALRLLRRLNPSVSGIDWAEIACSLGADVPVCLAGVATAMAGAGERLTPVPDFPPVAAVLANPRIPIATADVFRALGAPPLGPVSADLAVPPFESAEALLEWLKSQTNDLEPVARRICPAVNDVLAAISGLAGVRLARMSGSGATCFGLFDDLGSAQAAAANLGRRHPGWWVAASRLA
jgi:4-diphosphocytidyl-2-C-methyl-D-erythritol kinase